MQVGKKDYYFPHTFSRWVNNFLPYFATHSKLRARLYLSDLWHCCEFSCILCASPRKNQRVLGGLLLSPSLTFSQGRLLTLSPLGGSGVFYRKSRPQTLWWSGERCPKTQQHPYLPIAGGETIVIHGRNRELAWVGKQHHKANRLLSK